MFTTPAPAAPTVSATPVSTTSTTTSSNSPRSSGLRGGLSFLRNYAHGLHAHSASSATSPREDSRGPASASASSQNHRDLRDPRARSRAATTTSSSTPPASPSYASFTTSSPHLSADLTSSDLARIRSAPHPDPAAAQSSPPPPLPTMTRTRSETAAPQLAVRNHSGPTPASTPAVPAMDGSDIATDGASAMKHLPSIRFIPHQDPRAGRPSLQFPTITRTLPDESAIIRVGRYSERDNLPDVPTNVPSAAAVGFKSKVVSRKHCELWCKDGNWYIKDVKSSSGTFLNHIRLSQPNIESKPFRIKDGDIIQLGIDFRGGEEMIFRCVKIRVECNRGWQQGLNNFNKQTHQRLRNLGKAKKDGDTASTHTSECVICLMSIAPCQSLFVAPCSHVWHYKCIRPILNGPTWPNFLCPNCRAVADLEADAEDPGDFEEWDDDVAQANGDSTTNGENSQEDRHVTPRASAVPLNGEAAQSNDQFSLRDLQAAISNMGISDSLNGIANQPVPNPETPQRFTSPAPSSSVTQPVAISVSGANNDAGFSPILQNASHGLAANHAPECPMTPRNDAGPFVLDGSAGRASGNRLREGDDDSPDTNSTNAPTLPPLNID